MASLLQRIGALIRRTYDWGGRPGPLSFPAAETSEGWIPMSWPMNFNQLGWDPIPYGINSVVYACISLYARTISQLPGYHQERLENNGTKTIDTSALSRILKKPNGYQTRSDFMQNMVWELLAEGNAYALAVRNQRQEVASLHQMPSKSCKAYYGPPDEVNGFLGEVFYSMGGNPLLHFEEDPEWRKGTRIVVPQRDVLHIHGPSRPEDPMKGLSPLIAGGLPMAINSGAGGHFARFFHNMSRPSGVLMTDQVLQKEQVDLLRAKWEEQTKGANAGGTPILTAGLKWEQASFTAAEAQIAEAAKNSIPDIARLFGVPLELIDASTNTMNNTEQLILLWLRTGLGYYLEHIELAYDKLFDIELKQEYTEFIYETLLRTDFKNRVDGLARAVQGGIYAPNEARAVEGLKEAKFGDEPRLQAQVVPLSAAQLAPALGSAPAPQPANDKPDNDNDDAEDEDEEAEKAVDMNRVRKASGEMLGK